MRVFKALSLAVFLAVLAPVTHVALQHESQIAPPAAPAAGDSQQYGRRFFVQLRAVFGRFRDSDLQRVFAGAQSIQCSELINEPGEWRTVAFFNEKRELGDWYRSNFEEVKSDLSVFIFKGMCRGDHGPVQLTTKFPVSESVEAYSQGRVGLDNVEVNVNAAVRASYDLQSKAYTFDLPFLFLVGHQDDQDIYSLDPPRVVGRDRYATEVTDHWDCKSVAAENVTYQFIICRTTTRSRVRNYRTENAAAPFGASAYFILSDGKEAGSSVKLSFGDGNDSQGIVDNSVPTTLPEAPPPASWESPDSDERLVSILHEEFRLRLNPQTWKSRIGAAQVLSSRQISSLDAAQPAAGADYCVWLPADSSAAQGLLADDAAVIYSISARDPDGQSATAINFDMLTPGGSRFGSLQCTFPRVSSAGSVDFARWSSIVGNNLALEVRP
ncbi:MAG TPA: hypothetical protein VGK48_10835 [Terriglobia bacterium]|jgi:hypothetical protein